MLKVYNTDALTALREMADESVQCVVTSPPFWGLRDYGLESLVWDGDPDHEHEFGCIQRTAWANDVKGPASFVTGKNGTNYANTTKEHGQWCDCGAWRGCLGLEPTPDLYVQHLTQIFREVRRVLRPDGTLWLNLGDCYATGAGKVGDSPGGGEQGAKWAGRHPGREQQRLGGAGAGIGPITQPNRLPIAGLKPKDLVMMPARVALALQADGWYLRSDIVWAKPNPMPESVLDRPTKSHEYLFLLTKSQRYFYDAVAIQEESSNRASGNKERKHRADYGGNPDLTNAHQGFAFPYEPDGVRNKRSVWTIPTATFPDAHFATFPVDLVIPCILAGTSDRGACPICGAPWERITKRKDQGFDGSKYGENAIAATGGAISGGTEKSTLGSPNGTLTARIITSGWRTTCPCMKDYWEKSGAAKERHTGEEWKDILDLVAPGFEPEPCVVLDPFGGSGTTGKVAIELGRQAILIEPKAEYCEMIERRTKTNRGLPLA